MLPLATLIVIPTKDIVLGKKEKKRKVSSIEMVELEVNEEALQKATTRKIETDQGKEIEELHQGYIPRRLRVTWKSRVEIKPRKLLDTILDSLKGPILDPMKAPRWVGTTQQLVPMTILAYIGGSLICNSFSVYHFAPRSVEMFSLCLSHEKDQKYFNTY